MNLNGGYVKLFRKTLQSQVFSNDGLFRVWVWCLLKASHKEEWFPMKTGSGTTEVKVCPGQFVYGRKAAARELDIPEGTVRKRIEKLKNIGNLTIQPANHFSIITIVNWDTYQVQEEKEARQEAGQGPGRDQAGTTYKNAKKPKKENIYCAEQKCSPPSDPPEEIFISIPLNDGTMFGVDKNFVAQLAELYPSVNVEQELRNMTAWCLTNPKKRKTNRGVRAFISSWLKREQDKPKHRPMQGGSCEAYFPD